MVRLIVAAAICVAVLIGFMLPNPGAKDKPVMAQASPAALLN